MSTANAPQQALQRQQHQQQQPAAPTDLAPTGRPRRVGIALYRSVFVGNMGAFLVGMHFSLYSGILEMQHFAKTIGKHVDDVVLPVSSLTKSLVTAAFIVSMAVTAPFCGPLIDRVGRRPSLHAVAILFALSSVCTLYASSVLHIILTRLLAGLAYAIAIVVIPLYTSELAPPAHRGVFVNLYPVMLGAGILFAQVANIVLAHTEWTYPVLFSVLPAVMILFAVFTGAPESPVWLSVKRGDISTSINSANSTANFTNDEAVLRKYLPKKNTTAYDDLDVHSDFTDEVTDFDDSTTITTSTTASSVTTNSSSTNSNSRSNSRTDVENNHPYARTTVKSSPQFKKPDPPSTLLGVLRDPSSRYRLAIGVFLAVAQQLSGINAVFFFAPTIVNDVLQLEGTDASLRAAAAVGAVNLVACVLATFVVETTGRRKLLFAGAPPMALSLILMGAMRDGLIEKQAVLGLSCLLVYVAAFALTYGPVAILVSSEIFPPTCSGTCFSVCMGAFGLVSAAIGMTFLFVLDAIGGGVFYIFAASLAVTTVVIWAVVPETKGLTLQQIDQLLDGPTR